MEKKIIPSTMNTDAVMGLHFKALRLSQRYTEKQIEIQKLLLENMDILNTVRYDFTARKDLNQTKSSFVNSHNLTIPMAKLVTIWTKRIKSE